MNNHSKGGFMKCYLINLDKSRDRLEFMASQFERLGAQFKRVEAVNGRAMSPLELASFIQISKEWPAPLSPAEIGCFLSHRKCLEKIAAGEDAYAAVFEDDIRLSQGSSRFWASDHWIPKQADIVKIDAYGHEVLISNPVKNEGPYSISRLRSRHLQTGGYVVSREAARKLLPLMEKASAPVDHFLFDPNDGPFNDFEIYQISPAICRQSGMESTIGQNRRPKQRTSLLGLVWREAKRLVMRTRRNLKGFIANVTKTGRWGPIPFDRDIA